MTTSQQRLEQLRRERDQEASFQHTQLGVYLAGAFGLMYLWASSAQVCQLLSKDAGNASFVEWTSKQQLGTAFRQLAGGSSVGCSTLMC